MIASTSPDEPLEATLDRLRAAGRTPYVVRGNTKSELLDSFAAVLRFPEHYGRNLDALADCLREIDPHLPATIVWADAASFADRNPATYVAVRSILARRLPADVEALQCPR